MSRSSLSDDAVEGLEMIERLIHEGAARISVPLPEDAPSRLARLVELLLHWNKRVRVIGPCDGPTAVDRHVLDGLGLLRLLDRPEVKRVAPQWNDIGAGAGLPGLVLAVARPDLRLVLVEPIGKKVAFARHAAHELGLKNVEVQQTRLEALELGEGPGAAMSRATFAPAEWLRRGQELVGPRGLVLVSMGGGAPQDVVDGAAVVDRFVLPGSGAQRINTLHGGSLGRSL